jgi:DNA-binding SARP family transcriptional activator/Tfp pilus assembly protein PilF/TolB-like protein
MWTLGVLGRVTLRGDNGAEHEELLRQPKRLALLAYLALPRPGTWHGRDEVVALFWPEFDAHRARTALRNALYVLRKALGDEAIRGRGDDEVSVDPALLSCDAAEFLSDIAAGRPGSALDRYQGDLLAGLFVPDAAGFEAWLEQERVTFRSAAAGAAFAHAKRCAAEGNPTEAIRAARRAHELDGHDESALRLLLTLLDQTGDRAAALGVFERFRQRLGTELEVEPSPETMQLVAALRRRVDSAAPATVETVRPMGAAVDLPAAGTPAGAKAPRYRRVRWLVAGVEIALLGAIGIAAAVPQSSRSPNQATVLVLPMRNDAGDSLGLLARGLSADLRDRLAQVPGLTIRSIPPERGEVSGPALAEAVRVAGAGTVLEWSLSAVDSLVVRLVLRDARSSDQVWSGSFVSGRDDLQSASSHVTAAIAGALLGTALPPLAPGQVVQPESYRLTLEGLQRLLGGGEDGSTSSAEPTLFTRAIELDPTNARAWTGLSSIWASRAVTGRTHSDEGFSRTEDAARKALALDSTQGMAWGNLGVVKAVRDGEVAAAEELFRRGMLLEPGNSELHLILGAVLRFAGRYDRAIDQVRIAARLDPLSSLPIGREAFTQFCAGRPEQALRLYRKQLAVEPRSREGRRGVVRMLAVLARWDEAIAAWRESPAVRQDPALADLLVTASGADGYWSAVHAEGRKALPGVLRQAGDTWIAPMHVAVAYLKAGEIDSGLTILEREADLGLRPLFRLPCFNGTDEVRDTPRFQALLRRIPPLGARR